MDYRGFLETVEPIHMDALDCNAGFWVGMGILAGLTLAYILVCWLIPPKKQKR